MDRRNPAPPVNSSNDPLRHRRYLHFDERPPRSLLEQEVSSAEGVARWQFLPLLRVEKKTIRVSKNRKGKHFLRKEKTRAICYASHRDAALYATHAQRLAERYERILIAEDLAGCVIAFRPSCGKCNVHYAYEAFEWVRDHRPCIALAYDVKSFFDNLDHGILKAKWREVLGGYLPNDSFAVYRSVTRFSLIDRDVAYSEFKISKHNPWANGRRRICTAQQLREQLVDARKLHVNNDRKGIPQGTPISAVLSNIYMLDFDRTVAAAIREWGGLYRRYCDDILCVVPPEFVDQAKDLIERQIAQVRLDVQPDKLDERIFDARKTLRKPLQYLGLTFDGDRLLLRSSGIARYYGRMRRAARRAQASRRRAAEELGVPVVGVPVRRRKLNKGYSYLGRRNYISYAHRAARITGHDEMKRQVSRHWTALENAVFRPD